MAIENLMVKLMGNSTSYVQATMQAQRATDTFVGKTQKGIDSIAQGMTSLGTKMTIGVTAPMVAAGAGFVKAANDLNAAMGNVMSLGVDEDRAKELKKNVQEIAVLTGQGTIGVAEGLYDVVSAFGDSAESADLLKTSAIAAKAGLATTADSVALLSAVTKGYGDTSAEAVQKASDLAFQTVKLGQTTFPELARSIGKVTPQASALGVKQKELFSVMATATGVTGGAAEVSTQFKATLQALMSPSEDMLKLYEKQKVADGKALIAKRGLAGALKIIAAESEKTGKPLQNLLKSSEAVNLALALTGGQSDTFAEKLELMGDVTGATAEAFEAQTTGINKVGFSWDQAKVRGEVLAQNIGDKLLPIVEKLLTTMETMSGFMASKYNPAWDDTIALMVGVAAAAGPVLVVGGKAIQMFSSLYGIVMKLAVSLIGFLTPWIVIPVLIGAAIAAVYAFGVSWKDLQHIVIQSMRLVVDVFTSAWRIQMRVASAALGWIQGKIVAAFQDGFWSAIEKGVAMFKEFLLWIGEQIKRVFTGKGIGDLKLDDSFRAGQQGNLMEAIGGILKEETARFKEIRAGEESILPNRNFELRPEIGQVLESAKSGANSLTEQMLERLDTIAETNTEIAEKDEGEGIALNL